MFVTGTIAGKAFGTHPNLENDYLRAPSTIDEVLNDCLFYKAGDGSLVIDWRLATTHSLYGEFDLSETFADSGTKDYIKLTGICRSGFWPSDSSMLIYPKVMDSNGSLKAREDKMNYFGLEGTIFNNCETEWGIVAQNSEIKIDQECGTSFTLISTDQTTGYRYEITFNRAIQSL